MIYNSFLYITLFPFLFLLLHAIKKEAIKKVFFVGDFLCPILLLQPVIGSYTFGGNTHLIYFRSIDRKK